MNQTAEALNRIADAMEKQLEMEQQKHEDQERTIKEIKAMIAPFMPARVDFPGDPTGHSDDPTL